MVVVCCARPRYRTEIDKLAETVASQSLDNAHCSEGFARGYEQGDCVSGDVQVDVVEKAMVVGVSLILGTGIAYVIHVENNIADIIRIT